MLAQYYKDENIIRLFPDDNSEKLFDIPFQDRTEWGFPKLKDWQRTTWGYQLNFQFEVLPLENIN